MIHRISLGALESPFPRGDGSPSKAPDYYTSDADKTSKACHYERALLGDRTGECSWEAEPEMRRASAVVIARVASLN